MCVCVLVRLRARVRAFSRACVRACARARARSCASVHVHNHTCIRLLELERAGDECYPIDEITCVCAREFVRVCARAHPGLDVHSRF